MIIFRYLIAEVFKSQMAVFLVLMTIFVSQKYVKILADASEGQIPGQLVMAVIAFKLPQLAGLILPLSVFLGILLAYGRIYADSEMNILHACGVSEWYITRVTLVFSFVMTLLTAGVTLYLSPWAAEQEYVVREQAQADAGLSSIVAGRFQETSNKKAVIFVQNMRDSGSKLNKVFVAQMPDKESGDDKSTVVYANQGEILEGPSGELKLSLEDGSQYINSIEKKKFEKLQFAQYQLQIQEQEVEQKRRKLSAISTSDLISQKSSQSVAELQWRIAIPLSILLLTFIAVPLSAVNPRQGKFAKMLPALGLYLGYFVMLIAARSALEDGKIPSQIGLWWIHISALFIGAFLILKGRPFGSKVRARVQRRAI